MWYFNPKAWIGFLRFLSKEERECSILFSKGNLAVFMKRAPLVDRFLFVLSKVPFLGGVADVLSAVQLEVIFLKLATGAWRKHRSKKALELMVVAHPRYSRAWRKWAEEVRARFL